MKQGRQTEYRGKQRGHDAEGTAHGRRDARNPSAREGGRHGVDHAGSRREHHHKGGQKKFRPHLHSLPLRRAPACGAR